MLSPTLTHPDPTLPAISSPFSLLLPSPSVFHRVKCVHDSSFISWFKCYWLSIWLLFEFFKKSPDMVCYKNEWFTCTRCFQRFVDNLVIAPICNNSLYYYVKAVHQILKPGCGDLLWYSHKSISEVRHWCWLIRPGLNVFHFIPKVLEGVEVKFFHSKLGKQFCYGFGFVLFLYATVALIFPLKGT